MDRALHLWGQPLPAGDAALEAFRGVDADPLDVNAEPTAFAVRIGGRLVGPLATPLGELAPTGREVEVAGMDIFVVDEDADRVIGVWAIADDLGLLLQADAMTLAPTSSGVISSPRRGRRRAGGS